MTINIIAAVSENNVIGLNNRLPWHLKEDLRFFKEVTTNHTVVFGRKTYESIGKPLPNRENVILTSDRGYLAYGCKIVHAPIQVVSLALTQPNEVFIAGGAELYKQFIPVADSMYITEVKGKFAGDTFFPQYDQDEWELVWQRETLNCTFKKFESKK